MSEALFINYYDVFELDRRMTEKELKRELGKKQTLISRRESTTPRDDVATLRELQQARQQITEAIRILSNPASRHQYDLELDNAIRHNTVERVVTEEVKGIIEKARQFFMNENYELAAKYALEAIEHNINDAEPYELLGRSQFILGDYDEALETADVGSQAFSSAAGLRWLQIRLRILTEDFNGAQRCLNEALTVLPDNTQLHAEQIYLYYAANQVAAAEREMKAFMNANPSNMAYREYVAYNLVEIANRNYVYDSAADMLLITEKSAYDNCLKLITLANSIHQDEYVQGELQNISRFGELVYDDDHRGMKTFYNVACGLFIVIGLWFASKGFPALVLLGSLAAAFLFFLGGRAVNKISYRPVWQVYRDYYRGFKEGDDGALYQLLSLPYSFIEALFGN